MAASGGYWTKGAGSDVAGYVFIEKMTLGVTGHGKVGYAGVTTGGQYYEPGTQAPYTGTAQGGLIAHKALNSAGWNVTHAASGLAIADGFKSEAQAKAAMEKINQTGVKWKLSAESGAVTNDMKSKGVSGGTISVIKAQIMGQSVAEAKAGIASKEGVKGLEPKKAGKAMTPAEAKAAAKADADSIKKTGLNVADAAAAVKAAKAEAAAVKKGVTPEQLAAAKKQAATDAKLLKKHAETIAASSQEAKEAGLKHLTPPGYEKTMVVDGIPVHQIKIGDSKKWYVIDKNDDVLATGHGAGKAAAAAAAQIANQHLKSGVTTYQEKVAFQKKMADDYKATQTKAAAEAQAKLDAANAAKTAVTTGQTVKIKTLQGKEMEVEGTKVGENHSITHDAKKGIYHVNDSEGKTISTHASEADALSAAKDAALTGKTATPAYAPGQYKQTASVPANMHIPEGYAAYKSMGEANDALGPLYAAQKTNYASAEVAAMKHWSETQGCKEINGPLWKGTTPGAKAAESIKHLDAAFDKSALPHATVVVRADYLSSSVSKMLKGMKEGDVYHSKGYDAGAANVNWQSGDYRMIFHAPAGVKAIYLHGLGGTHYGSSEGEVLFARGLAWKISKVNGQDYHMEYIGESK